MNECVNEWPHSQGYQDRLRMHSDPDKDVSDAEELKINGWMDG